MDLKQYIPQIIAGILVLLGGGSLQYQASNDAVQQRTYADSNGESVTYLYIEVLKLRNEISQLKENHTQRRN